MYQLRTLWWRSHAHPTNSPVLPVAAMSAQAERTSTNIPTDRITSVRFTISFSPFRLPACSVEDDLTEGLHPLADSRMGCSKGLSSADLFLSIRLCVLCHHVDLTDDLAVVHRQRRLDQHSTAVRILTLLPEPHPLFADNLPLDAVRRLLPEGRSQVLGDLRLSAKLEGGTSLGTGVDDAQIRLLGVEPEDEIRVASLDGVTQSLEIQSSVSLAFRHFVYLLPAAPSKTLCLTDGTLWRRGWRHTSRITCLGYRVFEP